MGSVHERVGYRWHGDGPLAMPSGGRAERVGVWSCSRCGTAVTATGIHDRWHADVDRDLAVATGERAVDPWLTPALGAPGG